MKIFISISESKEGRVSLNGEYDEIQATLVSLAKRHGFDCSSATRQTVIFPIKLGVELSVYMAGGKLSWTVYRVKDKKELLHKTTSMLHSTAAREMNNIANTYKA